MLQQKCLSEGIVFLTAQLYTRLERQPALVLSLVQPEVLLALALLRTSPIKLAFERNIGRSAF